MIGGGFGARSWNLARNATNYLAKADAAEKEENWQEVVTNLTLFLQLSPKDIDAGSAGQDVRQSRRRADRQGLSALVVRPGRDPGPRTERIARTTLGAVGRIGPIQGNRSPGATNRDERSRRQGVLALALALYTQLGPDNRVTPEEVEQACKAALEKNPGDVKLSYALATTHREHFGKPASEEHAIAADKVIDDMVAASPQNPNALLARNQYDSVYRTDRADYNLSEGMAKMPENFQLLLAAGSSALVKKDTKEAVGYFRQAIEVAPTNPLGYSGLGVAYAEAGDQEEALKAWHDGLDKAENATLALNVRLARALIYWRRLAEAEKPLAALESELSNSKAAGAAASPLANEMRLLRCKWHMQRREFSEALAVLKAVNLNGPGGANLQSELEFIRGNCYAGLLEWDQAASAFDAASKTSSAPLREWLAAADAWEHAGRVELAAQRRTCGRRNDPSAHRSTN